MSWMIAAGSVSASPSEASSPSRSDATCRWRSGSASKVRRNVAGAVTMTEMPCGTNGWSSG
jgi:hypothetical protein